MNNLLINRFSLVFFISTLLSCSGDDGSIGPNGSNGLNSLINTEVELAGTNCEFGGLRVDTGIDNNSNGVLEDTEITQTNYMCSVAGKNSLINVVDLMDATECSNGGMKIETGVDQNSDGILTEEEIDVTRFICNGIDGNVDEQIRLRIDKDGGCVGYSGVNAWRFGELIKFDISSFPKVDSVILVVHDVRIGSSPQTGYVELYNDTDEVTIPNSTIEVTSEEFLTLQSMNVFKDLPDKEITLKIQVRTEIVGGSSIEICDDPYLYLYR